MMNRSKFIANNTTWQILQTTKNSAATVLLGAGLTNPEGKVRHTALNALIHRKCDAANMLVLSHWDQFNELDMELLRNHSHQFVTAIRTLLLRGTLPIKKMMLEAIAQLDLCESADILIELAINPKHPLHEMAGRCLTSMCRTWGRASRCGDSRGASSRPKLVSMVYNELLKYPQNTLIVNAWLSVVHWEDGLQRGILGDAGQRHFISLLNAFSETSDPAILQLLAGYYWRSTSPPSIQSIIVEQQDPMLAIEFAKLVSDDNLENVLGRMRSGQPLACMSNVRPDQYILEKPLMRRLMLMMAASREDILWTLTTCVELAGQGTADCRKLASEMLTWIRETSLERFVAVMQDDSIHHDGQGYRKVIQEILAWRNHASVVLRQASADFLRDFTVENLLRQIGYWPAQMCRIMGEIVAVVDKNMVANLHEQLTSPAPKKRLVALQAIEYLNCADQLRDAIMGLLQDPRIEIRVRVIDTLSSLNDQNLTPLLPQLLGDTNTDVVDAATRASRRIERQQSFSPATDKVPTHE